MKTSQLSWQQIKSKIKNLSHAEMLRLIGDLYARDQGNKLFLHARFPDSNEGLAHYKTVIRDAMCPHLEMGEDLQLAEAKRAIKDYKKATNNGPDAIELMMYYVECGNKFTLRYGDIDAKFYDSIIAIYAEIVAHLKNAKDEKLALRPTEWVELCQAS